MNKNNFRCLILFDVEGLFCSEKQDPEHDQKLFCLAVLSCSVLIVNNKTAISDEGLISLHRSIDFAQEFIVDNNEKRFEDLSKHFPALVWAIRDVKIPRYRLHLCTKFVIRRYKNRYFMS